MIKKILGVWVDYRMKSNIFLSCSTLLFTKTPYVFSSGSSGFCVSFDSVTRDIETFGNTLALSVSLGVPSFL